MEILYMPSKSARMKAMVVVRPTCGGPKKAGLVPRGTSFYGQWFMQSRGAQKVNKFIYPESCIGAPHKTGIAGCLRYLLKHIKEINARINWGLDKVFPGLDPKLGPRIPWWKKHLVLGAWEDAAGIVELLIKSAPDPAHPFAESDFWGIDYRNYSGKLKNCIRKVNAAIPNGTVEGTGKGEVTGLPENTPWALGQHYLGLLTEQEINEILLPNFYGIFLGERIMWVVDDVRLPVFDNDATTQGWEVVAPPSGTTVFRVALDGANVWILVNSLTDGHVDIYHGLTYDETVTWTQKPGGLSDIAVAGDLVFGCNNAGSYVYQTLSDGSIDWANNIVRPADTEKIIVVGASDKYLCVITEPDNNIYYTEINNSLVPDWKQIPGGLVKVSVGGKYIYGCNSNGLLYRAEWNDSDNEFGHWNQLNDRPAAEGSKLSVSSVSTDGEIVWITTTETNGGNIYYASADNNANKMYWNKIQAMDPNNSSGGLNLTQVYTGLSWTYGVSGSGVLYRRQTGRLFLSFENQGIQGSAVQGMQCLPGCQGAYPGDTGNDCVIKSGAVAMGDKFIKAGVGGLTTATTTGEDHWNIAANFVSKAGINICDRYLQVDSTSTSVCHDGTSVQNDCTDSVKEIIDLYQSNEPSKRIKGLYYDTEGAGGGEITFHTINYLATMYGLKRFWTRGINNSMDACPHNYCSTSYIHPVYPDPPKYPGGENYIETNPATASNSWDYALGQCYTNNTLELYTPGNGGIPEGCELNAPVMWAKYNRKIADYSSLWKPPYTHAAPLLCGAGNCQGDTNCSPPDPPPFTKFLDSEHGGPDDNACLIDERLGTNALANLLNNWDLSWANLGIWYGNSNEPSPNKPTTTCSPLSSRNNAAGKKCNTLCIYHSNNVDPPHNCQACTNTPCTQCN